MNSKLISSEFIKALENNIPIGGFLKQSFIDYPGNISAVIFSTGCNFRCNYCHNPQLVYPSIIEKNKTNHIGKVYSWLVNYAHILDAIVITGGEPTLHSALPEVMQNLKHLGLKIKLDTNGTNPQMLQEIIKNKWVDYIAMDIKAPLDLKKHQVIIGNSFTEKLLDQIKNTIILLNSNSIDYEYRTTLDNSLSLDDIDLIARKIKGNYYIQPLKINQEIIKSFSKQEIEKISEKYNCLDIQLRE